MESLDSRRMDDIEDTSDPFISLRRRKASDVPPRICRAHAPHAQSRAHPLNLLPPNALTISVQTEADVIERSHNGLSSEAMGRVWARNARCAGVCCRPREKCR